MNTSKLRNLCETAESLKHAQFKFADHHVIVFVADKETPFLNTVSLLNSEIELLSELNEAISPVLKKYADELNEYIKSELQS